MKRKVLAALMAGNYGSVSCSLRRRRKQLRFIRRQQRSAAGGDEHTLTLFAWDPNFNIPAMEAAGADYKENVDPDFNLEVIEQASSEDVETAITTAASAGNYETLPDIVLFQDHYIQQYCF